MSGSIRRGCFHLTFPAEVMRATEERESATQSAPSSAKRADSAYLPTTFPSGEKIADPELELDSAATAAYWALETVGRVSAMNVLNHTISSDGATRPKNGFAPPALQRANEPSG